MSSDRKDYVYDFLESRDDYTDFQIVSLSYAMDYFLLHKKNYTAIGHIYSRMKLYDNSELVRMRKSAKWQKGKRYGRSGFEGPDLSVSFSTSIYEDILGLAADRVVKKHDEELFEIIAYFIEGSVDEDSDPDMVFLQYYKLFLSLYRRTGEDVSYGFAEKFYKNVFAVKERQKIKTDDQSYTEFIEKNTEGTNFESEHFLEKSTDDMLREIGKFLGVNSVFSVYGEIRRFHPGRIAGTGGGDYLRRHEGLFTDVLGWHAYRSRTFSAGAGEWTDRKIHRILKNIVAAYYLNAISMQQRQEPGSSGRPDIHYFPPAAHILSELYYLLLLDSSLECIEQLQEDYYRSFSFDRITNLSTIESMNENIDSLNEELELLRRKLAMQETDLAHKDEELRARRRDDNEIIHDSLQALQRENEALENENRELKDKLEILDEYTRLLESPEDTEGQDDGLKLTEADMGRLMSERFVFVGGTPDIVSKLRSTFTSSLFVDNENQQLSLANVSYMVMFVKNMSHALYYKYIEAARSSGMPVIYCNMRNYDMVLSRIYDSITGGDSHGGL